MKRSNNEGVSSAAPISWLRRSIVLVGEDDGSAAVYWFRVPAKEDELTAVQPKMHRPIGGKSVNA
jgi:hypothetical protein